MGKSIHPPEKKIFQEIHSIPLPKSLGYFGRVTVEPCIGVCREEGVKMDKEVVWTFDE